MKKLLTFLSIISFSFANAQSVGGTVTGEDTVCSGSNSGTLTLSGHTGNIIRWQSSTDGGSSWSNISNTTTSQNYSNTTTTTLYRAVVQQGTNPTANSSPGIITVDAPSSASISGSTAVCASSNSGTLTVSGSFTSINYWEYSSNGGSSWNNITNTNTTQGYTNLTTTILYRANVTNGVCPSANTSPATITVNPVTVGGTVSGSTTVCAETNSGTLMLTGHTGNIVRWQYSDDGGMNWSNISNTSSVHNFSNISTTTAYRAVLQSGNCAFENSSAATVTVTPLSEGGEVNSSATVCSGLNNGVLELTQFTGDIIRWERSSDNGTTWTAIANTKDTLAYFNLVSKTLFRAAVQSASCPMKYSSTAVVNVNAPSIGGIVNGSDTVCGGTNSGTLVLSGQTGNVLRWQSSTDGGVSWTNISNTTTLLNYSNITQTTAYRAVVLNGACPASNSSEAVITVFPISSGGALNSSTSVCAGANNGTLQLTGYTGNIIRWDRSADNGLSWASLPNTTDTLNYNNLSAKTLFKALVQSGNCAAKYSSTATINVNPATAGGTVSGTDTVCPGSNGGTLTLNSHLGSILKWQYSTDGKATWSNISNTTTLQNFANLTTTTSYRAVVQNGNCAAVNSSDATITVYPLSVGGTLSPEEYSACSGSNNGAILLSGESGKVVYWEFSTDGGVSWTRIPDTTTFLNFQNLTATTKYRAVVKQGACAEARSEISTINVFPPTAGGSVSGSDTVCSGTNSGTVVLAAFSGKVLHWEKSTDGGAAWTNISNTTANQNYTNLVTTTRYRAIVQSGSCPTANSVHATITVSPPTIGGNVLSNAIVCDSSSTGTLFLSGQTGSVLRWEKSMDAGSSWTSILNSTNTYAYSGIITPTVFRAIVKSGACSTLPSGSALITPAQPAAAAFSFSVNGATVIFTNTSTGNDLTSSWSFGDSTISTITSPAHTYLANGSYAVTLVVYDSCGTDTMVQTVIVTGLWADEYNHARLLNVTPNPSDGKFTVTASHYPIQLKVLNMLGETILETTLTRMEQMVDLRGKGRGVYFYRAVDENGVYTGKLVVQ